MICMRRLSAWLMKIMTLGVAFLAAPAGFAEIPNRVFAELGLPASEQGTNRSTASLQRDLAWIGLHFGRVDGSMGPDTRESVRRFQRSIGSQATGELSPSDRDLLSNRARQTARNARFESEAIEWNGMKLDLPKGFIRRPDVTGKDYLWVHYPGRDAASLSILMPRFMDRIASRDLIDYFTKAHEDEEKEIKAEVYAKGTVGDTTYLGLVSNGTNVIYIFQYGRGETRGISISFNSSARAAMSPLVERMLRSLDLFHAAGVRPSDVPRLGRAGRYPGGEDQESWYRTMVGSGSGSVVSRSGDILTNYHVIAGCGTITVNGFEAVVTGADVRLDLALVRSERFSGKEPVRFRKTTPQLGEDIYVMGYPVFSMSPSVNLTKGIVSSAVGYKGDRTHVQITAPVQPGNSGGPVLDTTGAQIAVVAAKASAMAQIQSNIENIAWVIRSSAAVDFMQRYGVNFVNASEQTRSATPGERQILDWRQFTVRIECHDPDAWGQ